MPLLGPYFSILHAFIPYSRVRGKVNLGLTLLFALELVVNMFAHWFHEFWQSGCYIIIVEIFTIINIIIIIIIILYY